MAYRTLTEARTVLDSCFAAIDGARRPEVFISLHCRAAAFDALEQSFSENPDGALTGMIIAVKDNIDVLGFQTTAACPGYSYQPTQDAACVAELRAAGAVIIGKTNLDQFATGLVGTRSPYGAVRDAAVPERISGGSSSGSAVAVALGVVDAALGTDTAGSGRVPAGLQGIVGIKPTLGLVSNRGVVPACESYDCVTVFARGLDTAELLVEVMSASGDRPWPADARFTAPLRPVVGIPAELPALSASWKDAFADAVERARDAGCEIREINLAPSLDAARMLYDSALVAERAEAVGNYVADPTSSDVDPSVAGIVREAGTWTGVDVLRAQRELTSRQAEALSEWDGLDAVLVPTAPFHPTIAAVNDDPVDVNSTMGTYTNFCNLFDLCAVAFPTGVVPDSGRPQDGGTAAQSANFGVTVLAGAFDDGVAAGIAAAVTDGFGADAVEDSASSWAGRCGRGIPLTVFGAHLRGQPLNHELRSLGASFVGDVATAASYQLFALDTVPPKPGLSGPVTDGHGESVRGEEWLISPAKLGEFLAGLPAPMSLGQVELSDGRFVTGFSCQPAALEGAEDITRFGGWKTALAQNQSTQS